MRQYVTIWCAKNRSKIVIDRRPTQKLDDREVSNTVPQNVVGLTVLYATYRFKNNLFHVLVPLHSSSFLYSFTDWLCEWSCRDDDKALTQTHSYENVRVCESLPHRLVATAILYASVDIFRAGKSPIPTSPSRWTPEKYNHDHEKAPRTI